jgi:hypothetical protein
MPESDRFIGPQPDGTSKELQHENERRQHPEVWESLDDYIQNRAAKDGRTEPAWAIRSGVLYCRPVQIAKDLHAALGTVQAALRPFKRFESRPWVNGGYRPRFWVLDTDRLPVEVQDYLSNTHDSPLLAGVEQPGDETGYLHEDDEQ